MQTRKNIYALIFLISILHTPYLFMPAVNQEFAFADAAKYFIDYKQSFIDQYFHYQANTLGVPFLGYLLHSIIPIGHLNAIRFLNIIAIFLVGYSVYYLSNRLERNDSQTLLILLLLNPVIWTFSSRATADFLPMAIGLYSTVIYLKSNNKISLLLASSFLLGLAAILKYHALITIVFYIAFAERLNKKVFSQILLVLTIACLLLYIYLLSISSQFGFWITPPKFQNRHHLGTTDWLNNFVLYMGFLTLIAIPSSLAINKITTFNLKKALLSSIVLVTLFFIGYFLLTDTGEMNIGPADKLINKKIFNGMLFIFASMVFLPIFLYKKTISHRYKIILLAIIIILGLFSLSRPAQRYLLFILPFYLLITPFTLNAKTKLVSIIIFLFVFGNLFIGLNQYATGMAAIKMGEYIKNHNIAHLTQLDLLKHHVGNLFWKVEVKNYQYAVENIKSKHSIYSVEEGFLIKKVYSLEPVHK